jgi:hypothetical protein
MYHMYTSERIDDIVSKGQKYFTVDDKIPAAIRGYSINNYAGIHCENLFTNQQRTHLVKTDMLMF